MLMFGNEQLQVLSKELQEEGATETLNGLQRH